MELNVQVKNAERIAEAFNRFPGEAMRHYVLAMDVATNKVRSRATRQHRFVSRSGVAGLEGAMTADVQLNGNKIVGTVDIPPEHPYGRYVHNGTNPHFIFPVNKKILRFVVGGKFVFARAVSHPGTKADPFLYNALQHEEPRINQLFAAYTNRLLKKVGL